MRFIYHSKSGLDSLFLDKETSHYLSKVLRLKAGAKIALRNMQDDNLYFYIISNAESKGILLHLDSQIKQINMPNYHLHLIISIIESKIIEKMLPTLNELGVAKISFFYAKFSQRNFKLDLERLHKILLSSSQQCGRSALMEIEMLSDFSSVLKKYPHFLALDFNGEVLDSQLDLSLDSSGIYRILIGPEGGFSNEERTQFKRIISLPDSLILRTQSACAFIASAIKVLHK